MRIDEYKSGFRLRKSSKDEKFNQCFYPRVPFFMSRIEAHKGLYSIFKGVEVTLKTKEMMWEGGEII